MTRSIPWQPAQTRLTCLAFWLAALLLLGCTQSRAPQPSPTRPTAQAESAGSPRGGPPAPQLGVSLAPAPPAEPQPLDSTDVPLADPFDLARRLRHVDAPKTVNATPPSYQIGDQQTFWLEDSLANRAYTVTAVLRYTGAHAYIYLQQRAQVDDAAILSAGETFDTTIYPAVTAAVGPPAMPGIDNDSRITVLLADLRGMGGYFTQIDNQPSSIQSTSNQRKMIYIDLGSARPGTSGFDGYMAHEFQHLVHYNRNTNAQAWINEGMSELFREQVTHSLLNIPMYQGHTDTQLNDWPALADGSGLAHYGAAQSFLRYLLQHYGGIEQAGKLASEPGDGIAEVRAYLKQTGAGAGFEDVFADWLAANLINDPGGGRFSQNDPRIAVNNLQPLAVSSEIDATVHQFGAVYYTIVPDGHDLTLDFHGATSVPALPTAPHSGNGMWWSRRGDAIDTTLTRTVDLSGVDHATLQFATWYEIERDYDYGYLEVSADGGRSWTAIKAAHTTEENPFGIAPGPGYTGNSGGGNAPVWIDETADLTPFAGKRILLRFEYVTDEAANRNGWAIDDIRIPELGFFDDAETDGDWTAGGFERLDRPLPQRFIVQAIVFGAGADVQRLRLDPNNQATVTIPGSAARAVLIVSGATDLIRTPARFHIRIGDR